MAAPREQPERRLIAVRGVVQGVGFRPFVYGLACSLELGGFVQNRCGEVRIEVEGSPRALDALVAALWTGGPARARVEGLDVTALPLHGDGSFSIARSEAGEQGAWPAIAPDAGPCDACVDEIFDPSSRRAGYAFSSCTACGPRLTIATRAPYDRERTTMAGFALCEACAAEQTDRRDRRFHAQPIACAACGPRALFDGEPTDAVGAAARAIVAGEVVAVKGVGGYQLACDATAEPVVAALRVRKRREAKPFAVLAADVEAARALALVSDAEAELLACPARPIVLLHARRDTALAASIAPGLGLVGIMLPASPLHALLSRAAARPLVLTSGNLADEPIAVDDADAATRLAGVARAFLTHDRPIAVRCDDSVARVVAGAPVVLRRARGYVPTPVPLDPGRARLRGSIDPGRAGVRDSIGARLAKPTLAAGGELKAAFALGIEGLAVMGPHVGDLGGVDALEAFDVAVEHLQRLLGFAPLRIVHDAHPDLVASRWAEARARRDGLERHAVQHHHAHFAACLADSGHVGPAIGVCFDGAGFGDDGAVWGGELLVGDARSARRAGHLAYVRQPGGDAAAREPWRMAAAHLIAAGVEPGSGLLRVDPGELRTLTRMIDRGVCSPETSSVGRLFDAIASIAGLGERARYEAELAMRLESSAASRRARGDGAYPFDLEERGDSLQIVAAPCVRAAADDTARGERVEVVARRFHDGLAGAVAAACGRLRDRTGIADVALTGGVFCNAVLVEATARALAELGLRVHRHRSVPPNDGGLAFGQLAVLAARDRGER